MKLLSVNLSAPKPITIGKRNTTTGIYKEPASGAVFVGALGLEGDVQVSTKHHGGPDQAVYLYSQEDYDWFAREHGIATQPGMFGENLTLSGFGNDTLYVGDRIQLGEVELELTDPRIPCNTFAARMNDLQFVKKFKAAERPGVYARVLKTGTLKAGDIATYTRGQSDVSMLESFRLYYDKSPSKEAIERQLSAPVSIRARTSYEKMLAAL